MCPPDGRVAAEANSESSGDATKNDVPEFPSANEAYMQIAVDNVPSEILAHVVDVHCHPTDSDMATTLAAVQDSPMRLCAMATRGSDQQLVADLARAHPEKVTPCFGWYMIVIVFFITPDTRSIML